MDVYIWVVYYFDEGKDSYDVRLYTTKKEANAFMVSECCAEVKRKLLRGAGVVVKC